MNQVGLVLPGGGTRGVYISGVLDYFMEKDFYLPYVIGVSAGACNASTYLARQKGLARKMHINYVRDHRYISFRNLFKHKSLLGMDFIFNELPYQIHPIDFDTLLNCKEQFIITATDCLTGKAVYFEKNQCSNISSVLRASCSLPIITPMVNYEGCPLLDGGIADPIPIRKSIEDGNNKNIVVLTCSPDTLSEPRSHQWVAKKIYPKYGKLVDSISNNRKVYNNSLTFLQQLILEKKVLLLRPQQNSKLRFIERKVERLELLYDMGYQDAKAAFPEILRWIDES